ncbi:hypothetical protein ACHHYP_16133 [Achlya hypogyna]|uniref:DM10 domain-containing protein n=1 Tax=Achlya hypogyna TaxID=1202772 RepID=A0A1V9Y9N2_ACHHY|nr:hypothetical protein ACHHYP_16133 [Achlya hypogyna]
MELPRIPGLRTTHHDQIQKSHHRKSHAMARILAGAEEVFPAVRVEPPRSAPEEPPAPVATQKPVPSSRYQSSSTLPTWVTNDRQVLRFFCYFTEPAHPAPLSLGAPTQPSLVRRLVLLYYLSDASIEVTEPRIPNSGLAQGLFQKRTVLTSPETKSHFTPDDLVIGRTLTIKGQDCMLVDCDAATRDYYTQLKRPQPPPITYPDAPKKSSLEVFELVKSGPPPSRAKATAAKVQQFMQFSTQVLRFFCSWEDPHPLYPETRHFTLHYFLADDTIEVREARAARERRGSGRSFAVLLSRRSKPPRSVTPLDLRCGNDLVVFGRVFRLDDCDAFTKEYYLTTHGITQEPAPAEASTPNPADDNQATHDADDSLLGPLLAQPNARPAPRAPSAQCLRFRAKFVPTPEMPPAQAARTFIFTVHLADESLSIFEPRVPNSGLRGGKFLDRGHYKRAGPEPRYLRASDFYVGATLAMARAPSQSFILVEADEQTLAYCEAHPDVFTFADIDHVLAVAAAAVARNGADARRVCWAQRDAEGSSTRDLSGKGMEAVLRDRLRLHEALNPHEWITLYRRFVQPSSPIDDFCDALVRARASKTPGDGSLLSRLRVIPADLRRAIARLDTEASGHVSPGLLTKLLSFYELGAPEEVWAPYATPDGWVLYHRFFDDVYASDWSGEDHVPHLPRPPPLDERGPLYIPTYRSQLDTARFGVVPPAPVATARCDNQPVDSPEEEAMEATAGRLDALSVVGGPSSAPSTGQRTTSAATTPMSEKASACTPASSGRRPSLSSAPRYGSDGSSRPGSSSMQGNASRLTPTEIGSLLAGRFQTTSQQMHAQVADTVASRASSAATPERSVAAAPARQLSPEQRAALYTTTTQHMLSTGLAKARATAANTASQSQAIVNRARAQFLRRQQPPPTTTDLRSVNPALLRLFADRLRGGLYPLRKALQAQDEDGSGFVGEGAFMAALADVQATLSDDEQCRLANALFPTTTASINYKALLEVVSTTT